jgi:uncharacterized cupredoxin-like copper-binding protein
MKSKVSIVLLTLAGVAVAGFVLVITFGRVTANTWAPMMMGRMSGTMHGQSAGHMGQKTGMGHTAMGEECAAMHASMHGETADTVGAITPFPAADASGVETAATLSLHEWAVQPAELRIASGDSLRLTVRNSGTMAHALTIPALGTEIAWIRPGESRTVTIPPVAPGSYEYYCNLPGHKEAGQRGVLVVE